MTKIKAITGLPEEVDKVEDSCESCTTTIVVIKVFPIKSKTPVDKAGIKLTLQSDKSSAEGVTDSKGVITFEISDLKKSEDTVEIDTTDKNRPDIKNNICKITRGKDHSFPVELGSHIKAIYILNGKDLLKEKKAYLQFVNLPSDDKWVKAVNSATNSSLVLSKNRLSQDITIVVEFYYQSTEDFTVKMLAGAKNAKYSDGEKSRNKKYNTVPEDLKTTVAGKTNDGLYGEVKGKFSVTAAGGDNYSFEAIDSYGNKVTSLSSILTKRILFIQPLVMDNKIVTLPKNPKAIVTEYSKYHIELILLKEQKIDYFPNLDSKTEENFLKSAETVFKKSPGFELSPYSIALVFIDQSAVCVFDTQIKSIYTKDSQEKITLKTNILWEHLDKTDWFIKASYKPEPIVDPKIEKAVQEKYDKKYDNEDKIKKLSEEKDNLKNQEQITKLEKENKKLDEEIDELYKSDPIDQKIESVDKKLETNEKEVKKLKEEKEKNQNEGNELYEKLKKEKKEEAEIEKQLKPYVEEIEKLGKEIETLEKEYDELDELYNKLQKQKDINDDTAPIDIDKKYCVYQVRKDDGKLPGDMTFHQDVEIDLSKVIEEQRPGSLELQYNRLFYFRGGYSMKGRNLCTIVTRSKWATKEDTEKIVCMLHEIGHQFGMVPGLKTDEKTVKFNEDLDKHDYQYIGKGHTGSHCFFGIGDKDSFMNPKLSEEETKKIKCVMFGHSDGPPAQFCESCGKTLMKKDLSFGFKDFWDPYDPKEIWT